MQNIVCRLAYMRMFRLDNLRRKKTLHILNYFYAEKEIYVCFELQKVMTPAGHPIFLYYSFSH
jgi:hypothetical protein